MAETVAILVGGGPAPGINGVISAATIRCLAEGGKVLGIEQGFKFRFELRAQCVVHLFETERLQAAASRPHGEEHFNLASHGGFADVEKQFDTNAFGERLFEMEQTSVHGKLVKFRTDLPTVLELEDGEHGAAKFDPGAAVFALS